MKRDKYRLKKLAFSPFRFFKMKREIKIGNDTYELVMNCIIDRREQKQEVNANELVATV